MMPGSGYAGLGLPAGCDRSAAPGAATCPQPSGSILPGSAPRNGARQPPCRMVAMTADIFDTLVAAHAREATGVESAPPRPILLASGYLRLIARIEALAGNASGADKSRIHRAHADAVQHFKAAKRR